MILLMAPAPFHRIAENGEDSERACRVGVRHTLCGLGLLGAALACDVYVATLVMAASDSLAAALASAAAAILPIAWFRLPVARRIGRSRETTESRA